MFNQQLEHIVFQEHYFFFLYFFFVQNGGFYFLKQLHSALLCLGNRVIFSFFNSSCISPYGTIFKIVFTISSFIFSCDSREVGSSFFITKSFNSLPSYSFSLIGSSSVAKLICCYSKSILVICTSNLSSWAD